VLRLVNPVAERVEDGRSEAVAAVRLGLRELRIFLGRPLRSAINSPPCDSGELPDVECRWACGCSARGLRFSSLELTACEAHAELASIVNAGEERSLRG
jgi:hypothetical protein